MDENDEPWDDNGANFWAFGFALPLVGGKSDPNWATGPVQLHLIRIFISIAGGEDPHCEGDKLPPLSLLASIAMTIGPPIVAIGGGETSQLKKTSTAPEGRICSVKATSNWW